MQAGVAAIGRRTRTDERAADAAALLGAGRRLGAEPGPGTTADGRCNLGNVWVIENVNRSGPHGAPRETREDKGALGASSHTSHSEANRPPARPGAVIAERRLCARSLVGEGRDR